MSNKKTVITKPVKTSNNGLGTVFLKKVSTETSASLSLFWSISEIALSLAPVSAIFFELLELFLYPI